MIRDSLTPFPCLREGCADTAEVASTLCVGHGTPQELFEIGVALIKAAMALADCDLDNACVGECVCGDFPPCGDDPDAANDSLADALWDGR